MYIFRISFVLKTVSLTGIFSLFLFILACKENKPKELSEMNLNDFKPLAKIHSRLCSYLLADSVNWCDEKDQPYATYCALHMVCPNDSVKKIYVLPLGTFSDIEMKLIKNSAYYISQFFMLEVKIMDAVSDSMVPATARRINFGREQLNTRYIFDSILAPRFPKDAICFTAMTNKDLYPYDDYNFVFGIASFALRLGVSSYNRFMDEKLSNLNYKVCFENFTKTATHEIGHMFSLRHCTSYDCVLNQIDTKPYWLCPECLAKLQWCIKFDIQKRYDKLIKYSTDNGLKNEIRFYLQSKEIMRKSMNAKYNKS